MIRASLERMKPHLRGRRLIALVLVVLTVCTWLMWPEDPRKRFEIRETRAVTLEELGYTLPSVVQNDRLGIDAVRSGMTYDAVKARLTAERWILQEKSAPLRAVNQVNRRSYALTVPLVTRTLTATRLTRNQHRNNEDRFFLYNSYQGNYPTADTDTETLTVTMLGERHLTEISYRKQWSDRYQFGPDMNAEAERLRIVYGEPISSHNNYGPLESYYCLDTSGRKSDAAECKEGIMITITMKGCSDPNPQGIGFDQSSNPVYRTRVCELRISYNDKHTDSAFNKLRSLMYAKHEEIFGPKDPI